MTGDCRLRTGSVVAEGFVEEVGAELVGLVPDFRLDGQELNEVGGGDAEQGGGFADAGFTGLQHVKDKPYGGPKTRVPAAEVQPAVRQALAKLSRRRQGVGARRLADFQNQGLP